MALLSVTSAVPFTPWQEVASGVATRDEPRPMVFGFLSPSSFAIDADAKIHLRHGVLHQLLNFTSGATARGAGIDVLRCRGAGNPSPLTAQSAVGSTYAINDAALFLAPELLAEILVGPTPQEKADGICIRVDATRPLRRGLDACRRYVVHCCERHRLRHQRQPGLLRPLRHLPRSFADRDVGGRARGDAT
jgi:hypothetical protein